MALDFRVRIAWASDPFDPAPTWTDVSAYVEVGSASIDITRGSGDLDTSVNPGSLSLTFNNKDGRFTPGYTGGAYYPNVVLGKRIQVHETTNGIAFNPRFDGYIDTLPMQWAPSGRYAEAQVTAVDRLKKLGKQIAATDPIGLYINNNAVGGPADYFTLGDADGTTSPANSGTIYTTPGVNLQLGGLRIASGSSASSGVTFGSATGPADGLTAAESVNSSLQATHPQVFGIDLLAMGFFRIAVLDPTFGIPSLFSYADVSGNSSQVGAATVDNSGVVHASLTGSGGTTTLTGPNINDGATHHVAVILDSRNPTTNVTTLSLYVDGALADTNTLASSAASPAYQVTEWMRTWPITANGTGDLVGAHLATFTTSSAAPIADIATAGLTAFAGEPSSTRFGRILSLAGITSLTVTGTSVTALMGPFKETAGRSYLDLLQDVQDTENGAFFVRTDGVIEVVARSSFYNQAATLTLSNGQYGTDLMFLADDSRLINDVTVTDATGTVQRLQNSTSITANGTYSVQKTLNTLDSNEALSWAQWQINQVSSTSARISQVTVNLLTQQSLIPSVVAVEIGDRIDLTGLPAGAPSSSVSLQVAGYTESYSAYGWTVTFNTIPFLTGNVFTFNDATLGRFDTGGVFAY